jgi:hypothetical protein
VGSTPTFGTEKRPFYRSLFGFRVAKRLME